MRILVGRSLASSVAVDNKIVGSIEKGLIVFVGFTYNDNIKDIEYLINKLINLRIFDDESGVMNRSILDINASILSISQFTLYADTTKGNRPSYSKSLNKEEAINLYDLFNEKLKEHVKVETGIFGADMKVSIINDGPINILLESRNKNDEK